MPRSSVPALFHFLIALVTLLALGALLTGPAYSTAPAASTAAEPPARAAAVAVVVIEGSPAAFIPQSVTIRAGDSVRWLNNDNATHTTTSDTGLWDIFLTPGTSVLRTFPTPGTFRYHCDIHPNMTGTITVV
ncbi:cupredoxin domain-containing protein [Streptomyces syringium]|uniref:cupredoxin domain-containing protein n=1 Tax=Streptomyces syringium TaxID=76729 RepID=UPI0034558DE4